MFLSSHGGNYGDLVFLLPHGANYGNETVWGGCSFPEKIVKIFVAISG